MTRAWAWYRRQPLRIRFLIPFVPLFVCGLVFFHAPAPDNTVHHPAVCQRVIYNTQTKQEVVVNYPSRGGGGCK